MTPTPSNTHLSYVSKKFKHDFEPMISGEGADIAEAKVIAPDVRKRAGCGLVDGQPPLKCHKTANLYFVEVRIFQKSKSTSM